LNVWRVNWAISSFVNAKSILLFFRAEAFCASFDDSSWVEVDAAFENVLHIGKLFEIPLSCSELVSPGVPKVDINLAFSFSGHRNICLDNNLDLPCHFRIAFFRVLPRFDSIFQSLTVGPFDDE